MSNPTTPFSWQMPTATDLVTDLPADFEVFGQAVATSMADLLGGTTGQVLAKTTNTDMDFTWTTPQVGDITGVTAGTGITGGGTSGTVTVTNDMATTITTSGDLIYGTGSGTYTRRGIGSTGNVLTVSGGVPTWAAPAGGGKVLQVIQSVTTTGTAITSTSLTDTSISATITPTLNTSKILVLVDAQVMITKNDPNLYGGVAIIRGVTNIYDRSNEAAPGGYFPSTANFEFVQNFCLNYLDSPATTSSTTYKVQYKRTASGGTATFQRSGTPSSITLLEIGA